MRRDALRWQVLVLRVYSLGLTRDVSSRRDTVRGLSLRGVSPCLLALALEARARALGKLREEEHVWRERNKRLLGAVGSVAAEALRP